MTDFETLPLSLGTNGELTWSAIPGEIYFIESSSDFSNWVEEEQRVATSFEETASDPDWEQSQGDSTACVGNNSSNGLR